MEEIVVQHHEIQKVNPTSLNTVRVLTAVDKDGKGHVIGACLRCGGKDAFVDNFHAGGVVYPIDIELGIINHSGRNNRTLDRFSVHPGSNTVMIGFKIPNWDIVMRKVIEAAELIPEMNLIGWDIAITEDGVEFIEANHGADSSVIQFDHIGKLKKVRDYIGDDLF